MSSVKANEAVNVIDIHTALEVFPIAWRFEHMASSGLQTYHSHPYFLRYSSCVSDAKYQRCRIQCFHMLKLTKIDVKINTIDINSQSNSKIPDTIILSDETLFFDKIDYFGKYGLGSVNVIALQFQTFSKQHSSTKF